MVFVFLGLLIPRQAEILWTCLMEKTKPFEFCFYLISNELFKGEIRLLC